MRRFIAAAVLAAPFLLAAAPANPAAAGIPCGRLTATMVFADEGSSVSGTSGDDVVVLRGEAISFQDPGGNDVICAEWGSATLRPGTGDDWVYGGTGATFVFDGPGTDHFIGGDGLDDGLMFDGDGIVVHLTDGHERGNDDDVFEKVERFIGTVGPDVVVGTAGNDDFESSGGNDRIDLGPGYDQVSAWDRSVVHGGPGSDDIQLFDDATGYGDAGFDQITAGDGRATVFGGPGDDWLIDADAYPGRPERPDTFRGGPGLDRLDLAGLNVHLEVADGRERGNENDRFTSVEEFHGTPGDDVFVGTLGADTYVDDGGHDRIDTGSGDDVVVVTKGATVRTGPGDDKVYAGDHRYPDTDPARIRTGSGDDEVSVAGPATVWTERDDDSVSVWSGEPAVDTGPGADLVLVDSARPERVAGGSGVDKITLYFAVSEGVVVDLAEGWVKNETVGTFPIDGIENVHGSGGDDVIYGDDGPNELSGWDGEDMVDGLGGDDVCEAEQTISC